LIALPSVEPDRGERCGDESHHKDQVECQAHIVTLETIRAASNSASGIANTPVVRVENSGSDPPLKNR